MRRIESVVSFSSIVLFSGAVGACQQPGVTEQQKENPATELAASSPNETGRQYENAQASAEKDRANAQLDFETAREDYRHTRRQDLTEVDKEIVALKAKARTATGKAKVDLGQRLPAVRSEREAFARHLQDLDTATMASWDSTKANLDKEWDSLKSSVEGAR